jgi:hypothetical protein
MDAKLKAKWVKALRSGRYKQTPGQLHDSGGYCCLGVLATILGAKWRKSKDDDEFVEPYIDGKSIGVKDNASCYLSPTKIGISKVRQNHLGNMNDGLGKYYDKGPRTFKEIADYIEKNL